MIRITAFEKAPKRKGRRNLIIIFNVNLNDDKIENKNFGFSNLRQYYYNILKFRTTYFYFLKMLRINYDRRKLHDSDHSH
jgi:hypothetical protein